MRSNNSSESIRFLQVVTEELQRVIVQSHYLMAKSRRIVERSRHVLDIKERIKERLGSKAEPQNKQAEQ